MTSQTDTSPEQAWIDAQGQATANSTQQTVTVQPDDTLTRIANSHGYAVDAVEAANPQITNPNLIFAGETVYLPTTVPPQKVTAQPDDNLTRIANSHGYTVDAVETANPQITNPNLIFAGETVYLPTTVRPQVVKGVDNSEVQPIITDMANANAADQAVQAAQDQLRHPVSDRAARQQALQSLKDAREASAQAWNQVQDDTFKMLMINIGGPFPDQTAAAQVQQLNALEPGNAKFAAATNAALDQAKKEWKKLGITEDQLRPILDDYNKAQQAKNALDQYLANPDPNPAADHRNRARLTAAEQKANDVLLAQIEATLTDVANMAGSDPAARSGAMMIGAGSIQTLGPQDPAFQKAVDDADYDLQVKNPAAQVADAYKKGGALAAADKLKAVTQDPGNSYYAGQIIQASAGTIDSITKDMGNPLPDGHSQTSQIYADLSQSVNAATKITVSGSGTDAKVTLESGQEAADLVANYLALNGPTGFLATPARRYDFAASAVSNGDGVMLTLATAAALKRQGNSEMAIDLAAAASAGLDALQSKTQSDVAALATTIGPIGQLQATWGPPFMTSDQLDYATAGYLKNHPDVAQSASNQLKSVSHDGDAIAEAEVAWQTYSSQLDDITGQTDLPATFKSLIADKTSTFAVLQSSTVTNAIVAASLGMSIPHSGGVTVQAFLASDLWRTPRTGRLILTSFTRRENALTGLANIDRKAAGEPLLSNPFGQGTSTALSFGALMFVLGAGIGAFGQPLSPEITAFYAYAGLGIPIFTLQTLSGVTKLVAPKAASKLGYVGLPDTGGFKNLVSTYFVAASAINDFAAVDDIRQRDWGKTVFDSSQGLGNLLNAAKTPAVNFANTSDDFLGAYKAYYNNYYLEQGLDADAAAAAADAIAPDAAAAAATLVGETIALAGSTLAVIGAVGIATIIGIRRAQEVETNRHDNSEFLQQGLGLRPDVADTISAYTGLVGGDGLLPELEAYAKAYNMTAPQLLQELNQQPTNKVIDFINTAFYLTQGGTVTVNGTEVYPPPKTEAGRVQVLKDKADSLFGKNQLGSSQSG